MAFPTGIRQFAWLALTQKLVLAALIFLFPVLFPTLFDGSKAPKWAAWDTEAYVAIASHGYEPGAPRCAFYPLWPACIRIGSWFTGGEMVLTAWLLGNILSLTAVVLFYCWVAEQHGEQAATCAAMLLLFYPGSVFLFAPYSESLFLLLIVVCMFSLHRKFLAGVLCASFLLPMTRAIGIFILPVLVWELVIKRRELRKFWICFAPALGYLVYLGIMYVYTGNPFEGFTMQLAYPSQPSIERLLDIPGFLRSLWDFGGSHDALRSWIDRLAFVVVVLSLYFVLRIDTTYYIYALLAGVLPAITNNFMSYTRFSALVFPLFIAWAGLGRRGVMFSGVILLFYGVQVLFLLLFSSGRWVG